MNLVSVVTFHTKNKTKINLIKKSSTHSRLTVRHKKYNFYYLNLILNIQSKKYIHIETNRNTDKTVNCILKMCVLDEFQVLLFCCCYFLLFVLHFFEMKFIQIEYICIILYKSLTYNNLRIEIDVFSF